MTGFRRLYQLDLYEALRDMNHLDVGRLINELYDRDMRELRDSENLAMLVDRVDFDATFEYSGAVTDPEDPDVKQEQARRKKAGIRPPPTPLWRPVAQRASELREQLIKDYEEEAKKYNLAAPGKKMGLSDLMQQLSG